MYQDDIARPNALVVENVWTIVPSFSRISFAPNPNSKILRDECTKIDYFLRLRDYKLGSNIGLKTTEQQE